MNFNFLFAFFRKDFKNFLDGFMFCEDGQQISVSSTSQLELKPDGRKIEGLHDSSRRGGKWVVVGSVLEKKRGVKNKNTEGLT